MSRGTATTAGEAKNRKKTTASLPKARVLDRPPGTKLCQCPRCVNDDHPNGSYVPKKKFKNHNKARSNVRTSAAPGPVPVIAATNDFSQAMDYSDTSSPPCSPPPSDPTLAPVPDEQLDISISDEAIQPDPRVSTRPADTIGSLLHQYANTVDSSVDPSASALEDVIESWADDADHDDGGANDGDAHDDGGIAINDNPSGEMGPRAGDEASDVPPSSAGPETAIAPPDSSPMEVDDQSPKVTADPHHSSLEVYKESSPHWLIRLFLLMTIFLNLRYHVGTRACGFLLAIMKLVAGQLHLVPKEADFPVTLQTTMRRFQLHDRFTIYVLCPNCSRVYPLDASKDAACTVCGEKLYTQKKHGRFSLMALSARAAGRLHGVSSNYEPRISVPIALLSGLIERFLAHEGVEEGVEAWMELPRDGEQLNDVMDGAIWQEIKGVDKKPFFSTSPPKNELRLGFSISLDWFQPTTSSFSGSHSSGILSVSCANLPPSLRYRVLNVLALLMTPGPEEPTGDELQHLLKRLIDDFIMLYRDGVIVRTPMHPQGRLVRAVVIATICDHPAMCKMLGLADHSHGECPCPICTITTSSLHDETSLSGEGYPSLTNDERRALAEEYRSLPTERAQKAFFKKHGVRWSEFHRLSYFDFSRMAVIDPMHNLLLGVVKTHWYSIWIKKKALRADTDAGTLRELGFLHELLHSLEAPPWIARLPNAVGEPAGGSLTADEYKFLVTILAPLVIPLIWDKFSAQAAKEFPSEVDQYHKAESTAPAKTEVYNAQMAKFLDGGGRGRTPRAPPQLTKPERPRMLPEEPDNFLTLSKALTILLSSSVRRSDLDMADGYLRAYLKGFQQLHPKNMTPNHHWALHTRSFIRDYGPVYGFWAFLSERVNFHMKQFSSNYRDGGQIEIIMMRAFMRDQQLSSMISAIASSSTDDNSAIVQLERNAASLMANLSRAQSQGAISNFTADEASLEPQAEDHELSMDRTLSSVSLSPASSLRSILVEHRAPLIEAYNLFLKSSPPIVDPGVRARGKRDPLAVSATFHTFMMLNGRRIVPISAARVGKTSHARASLVRATVEGKILYGEVLDIFEHRQGVKGSNCFARVQWMKRVSLGENEDFWSGHRDVLDIQAFEKDRFEPRSKMFPSIIPLGFIECPIVRMTQDSPNRWLTLSLPKHGAA